MMSFWCEAIESTKIFTTFLNMATAIEFENISKQYRLDLVSTGTLSHDLNDGR
ncbi:hypothetical protein SAMN05720766_101227 [Fibrobacter sp. UWH9]|nr:hypothetical protein SAMN05720766_101227 [Fibrobacter sp. UWH9]